MGHTNFATAFIPHTTTSIHGAPVVVTVERLPDLVVTSGRLAAFDGALDGDDAPPRDALQAPVPNGRHRVDVALAAGDVAAVRVRFRDAVAVRWEPAALDAPTDPLPVGQDPAHACRSGVSALACASRIDLLLPRERRPWTEYDGGGVNVLAFHVGEDEYPAYLGFDDHGLVEVCVDYRRLTRPVWQDVALALPLDAAQVAAEPTWSRMQVAARVEGDDLVIVGDVRRLWAARFYDDAGRELGAVHPRAGGRFATFQQRYETQPWRARGARRMCIRVALPDEPLTHA